MVDANRRPSASRERLSEILSQDLNFHGEQTRYATHGFHSFPAKFPPQLPRKFIAALTQKGDVVLDPMMGSGTTIVEAQLLNRQAVGFDIDPLAHLLVQVKVCPLDTGAVRRAGHTVVENAKTAVRIGQDRLQRRLAAKWNQKTKEFVDYWFAPATQIELLALVEAISQIPDEKLRSFFDLALSATIITKSGGVSLALDLAHTRPHRARAILDSGGRVLQIDGCAGSDPTGEGSGSAYAAGRTAFLTKRLRSPIEEFRKRYLHNMEGLPALPDGRALPRLHYGNARALALEDSSVDLIVTSPPYASNAIDYMRAHKFSLVWLGHSIGGLGETRKRYIGGESTKDVEFCDLPEHAAGVVARVSQRDARKGLVLHRYFSEMTAVIHEMYRVLRPGKAAVVVVGSSEMRGVDTQTGACLAEIGLSQGFELSGIGIRQLDRNRRMMPVGAERNRSSQIQRRMHQESVIGFSRPYS